MKMEFIKIEASPRAFYWAKSNPYIRPAISTFHVLFECPLGQQFIWKTTDLVFSKLYRRTIGFPTSLTIPML
jgi:hypothetical protein